MTEFLIFAAGLSIGFLIAWIFSDKKNREQNRAQIQQLESELKRESGERIKAESELSALKKSDEMQRKSFESIAGNVLQKNSELFLQIAGESLNKYTSDARKDFNYNKEAVGEMLKPLKESLDKHEELVKNLNENSNKTFGSLRTYLEELNKSQQSLEKETGALVNALKSPKVRGRWGEIGLKRIVEFSGMSEYCDFEMQVHVSGEDGRMRPDMIVNLPGGKRIAVDSKVPLNSFLEMLETDNEKEKAELSENHAKAVARHMRELSAKNYWAQFDETVDFVVMYIEVEPAFGAALSVQKNLLAEAVSNRIVFATPTTLIALLQTVAYSWKQQTATENAVKIWKSGKDLFERLVVFTDYLQKLGNQLASTVKTYNQAVGSWESRVMPGVKKLESLGSSSEKKSLPDLEKIDVIPRE
jgi:DNA recombination protein RmuC